MISILLCLVSMLERDIPIAIGHVPCEISCLTVLTLILFSCIATSHAGASCSIMRAYQPQLSTRNEYALNK